MMGSLMVVSLPALIETIQANKIRNSKFIRKPHAYIFATENQNDSHERQYLLILKLPRHRN
jgi:hypothetical protein